jgi:hypothetical protein
MAEMIRPWIPTKARATEEETFEAIEVGRVYQWN